MNTTGNISTTGTVQIGTGLTQTNTYLAQVMAPNGAADSTSFLAWRPTLADNNLYTIDFNYIGAGNMATVTQCGMGQITTAKGVQSPTTYSMAHAINAGAEWCLVSTG